MILVGEAAGIVRSDIGERAPVVAQVTPVELRARQPAAGGGPLEMHVVEIRAAVHQ